MSQTQPKTALVATAKAYPQKSGGGLGVAYWFLSGILDSGKLPADVDLYALCGDELVQLPTLQAVSEYLTRSGKPKLHGPRQWVHHAKTLGKLAKKYDHVAAIGFTPLYSARLAKLFSGKVKVIHTEHAKGGRHTERLAMKGKKDAIYYVIKRFVAEAMGNANVVVFPSAGAHELFVENNPAIGRRIAPKVQIVHNGIREPVLPKVPQESLAFSIAHHVPEKGIEVVLEALRIGRAKYPSFQGLKYVNVGKFDEPYTSTLKAQVKEKGLEDCVTFRGPTPHPQVMELLAKCNMFVLTPPVVVFDLALLEAMAAEKPIVSTPCKGNKEALGDDYPLFTTSPEQVAEKIDWVLRNTSDAKALGAGLRARFLTRFSHTAMAEKYVNVARSLCGLTPSGGGAAASGTQLVGASR